MLLIFFTSVVVLYLVIGVWTAYDIRSTKDFFVAEKSLSLKHVVASLVVTQLGGSIILDTSRKGFEYGIYGFFYPLGLALGFLLLHRVIAYAWYKSNIHTTAEFFKVHYKSIALQKVAACISIISLMGILVAQAIALRFVICPYISVARFCLFAAIWFSVIVYSMLGGLRAIIATDFIQGVLIYGFFTLFIFVIFAAEPYSLQHIFTIAKQHPFIPPEVTLNHIISLFLLPGLFVLISQDVIQFILKAKTPKIAKQATSLSAYLMIGFAIIPFLCGLVAKAMALQADESTHVILTLMESLLPTWILSLGLCAITAAIISTADSMLVAITNLITQDILPKSAPSLRVTRSIIVIVGIVSLLGSYAFSGNIIQVILYSYELALSTLLIPIMAQFFLPAHHISTGRAWISCLLGGMSFAINVLLLPAISPRFIFSFLLASVPFMLPRKPRKAAKELIDTHL